MKEIIKYKITLKLSLGALIENIIFKPKSKMIILNVQKQNVKMLLFLLKKLSIFNYKCLMDILVVDYPSRNKRFELVYCLLSVRHNKRLLIKTFVSDKELMQSMTALFKSANWLERECWDLYGVFFKEHSDLRRILTDYVLKAILCVKIFH